jgi:hypothetical protein
MTGMSLSMVLGMAATTIFFLRLASSVESSAAPRSVPSPPMT